MTKEEKIEYWIESSDKDFEAMKSMYASKNYSWSLFIGHLVIEKLLKAYFIKMIDDQHPYIHDLVRIAEKTGIEIDNNMKLFLTTVTTFNLNARYNDYKATFYNKCTAEYTEYWINQIMSYRIWIKEQLLK